MNPNYISSSKPKSQWAPTIPTCNERSMKFVILLALFFVTGSSAQSLKYSHFVPGHNAVFSLKESGAKDHFNRETYLKDSVHNGNEWAVIRNCSIANKEDSCDASRTSITLSRESAAIEENQKIARQYYLETGAKIDSHTIFLDDTVVVNATRNMNFRKEATCTVEGRIFNDCFHIFFSNSDTMFYDVYMSSSEGLLRKEQRNGSSYSFLAQRVFAGASSTMPKVVVTPFRPRSYLVNGRPAPASVKKFQANKK